VVASSFSKQHNIDSKCDAFTIFLVIEHIGSALSSKKSLVAKRVV
jgi:hypothetical protein